MKQVAVFAPVGTLDHQTGIMNAIHCFASAGWHVDLYTVRNSRYPPPQFANGLVDIHYMPWHFNAEREPRTLVTLLFCVWTLAVRRRHSLVFAGGIRGLFAASLYSVARGAAVINYQTELYIGSKLDSRAKRLFKWLERTAMKRPSFTIEHDQQRKALLCADLNVPPDRVLIVPNSPCGPSRSLASTLLHDTLNLPRSTPLLLSPGTLNESFETSKIVRAAQALPPHWRCVVHSAQPRLAADPYILELAGANCAGRVVFSLNPLPYGKIDELLASARIGLALYSSEVGENTSTVGLASGKLSHFLKLGIPVIVSPLPGLADFVRSHGVGEVLDDERDLPALVERIERDEAGYRRRCLECFDKHLAYDRAFRQVLDFAEAHWRATSHA